MKNLFLVVVLAVAFQVNAWSQERDGKWLAENFYLSVLGGDAEAMLSAFSDEPTVNTPRTGEISGVAKFTGFVEDEHDWLNSLDVDGNSLTHIKTTESAERVVYEQSFVLKKSHGPVKKHNFAVVVDLDKGKAEAVRVYYGLNAINGRHDFSRPAMLEHDPALFDGLAPPVKQYLASIGNGYRDVYRMFVDDGCFGPFCGINRAKFFVIAMHTGPVPIKLTTATCDETSCATEENLASWGDNFSINTAGLAVFEFNDSGQISYARVYDDIQDVAFLETGWFAEHWDALSMGFAEVGCPLATAPTREDSFEQAFAKILMQPCETGLPIN